MATGVATHKSIPFGIGSDSMPGFSKLIEEAGETLQEVGKIIGAASLGEHWDGKGDLKDRLEDELADLQAAILFVRKHNNLNYRKIEKRIIKKFDKFERWHFNIQAGRDPNDNG